MIIQEQKHAPVMLDQVLSAIHDCSEGYYLDATWGRGGYTRSILKNHPDSCVIAFDKDHVSACLARKEASLNKGRLFFLESCFSQMPEALTLAGFDDLTGGNENVSGIVFDLGLSLPQLTGEGGFSFMREDDFLDMRISRRGSSAASWLASARMEEIAKVIKNYGEEPSFLKIADAIVKARKVKEIVKVGQLVEIISSNTKAIKGRRYIHPATRTFMAIRMFINKELENLAKAVKDALQMLAVGGRLAIVTFHSLEDRLIKKAFSLVARPLPSPSKHIPYSPIQEVSNSSDCFKIISPNPQKPIREEVINNPRARSAKLRVIEKVKPNFSFKQSFYDQILANDLIVS